MQIAILGKGNMGVPLAKLVKAAGHEAQSFGSKDNAVTAITTAEVIILAMKYEEALAFVNKPGISDALRGKTVIDITNPLAADYMSLTIGHDTSAGEEIANALPEAHIVKAFNTVFASVLADHAASKTTSIPVFVAGDDQDSVDKVLCLVRDVGLVPITAGTLSNARYLEPMTEMMIQLGYGLGHGDRIGFGLITTD